MAVPLEELEAEARGIGHALRAALPVNLGFTLVVYDYAGPDTGHMTYIASGERADTVKLLRELCDKIEGSKP